MTRENTGRYRFAVVAHDSGHSLTLKIDEAVYDVASKSFSLDSKVPNLEAKSGDPSFFTVHTREIGGKSLYMQAPRWRGTWHGCWLPITRSTLDSVVPNGGRSLSAGAPVPVLVALTARSASSGGNDRIVHAVTYGRIGLELLGVSAKNVLEEGLGVDADDVRVPISIELVDGHIQMITAKGSAAKKAFDDAKVSLGTIGPAVAKLESQTIFRPAGAVSFNAPDRSRLLPPDAAKTDTCPAHC